MKYDVATSDKYCFCTCYNKNDKPKLLNIFGNLATRWKLGAPTTSKPAWAQKIVPSKAEPATTTTEKIIKSTDKNKVTNASSNANSTQSNGRNTTVVSSPISLKNVTKSISNQTSSSANATKADKFSKPTNKTSTLSSNKTLTTQKKKI